MFKIDPIRKSSRSASKVQALVSQNTSLEEQIQTEKQVKSAFGWLTKLLAK